MLRLSVLITCLLLCSYCFATALATDSQALPTKSDAHKPVNPLHPHHSVTIELYYPTYILPFYHTQMPDNSIYTNSTPNEQQVKHNEFKAQFSLLVPFVHSIFSNGDSINFAYTQLMYWQLYTQSPYFREINYQPELFYSYLHTNTHWRTNVGVMHQSNGKGGDLERSWNRVYLDQIYHSKQFYFDIKPWFLIFKSHSSTLHNPDITSYLGHGKWIVSYLYHRVTFSVSSRNNIESGFKRGSVTLSISYPVFKQFRIYLQGFAGYGQSLIEYNHYTNAIGIGVALNDWL